MEGTSKNPLNSFVTFLKSLFILICDIVYFNILLYPILLHVIFKLFYTPKKNVTGKLALVTGGGRGIGRSICLKLSNLGCRIAVVDIDERTAGGVAEEIRALGGDAQSFKADISKVELTKKLRDDVASTMGSVDILVNNAGLIPDMNFEKQSPEFDEAMVKVNVLGTFWMTETFLDQMKLNDSGHIISIASMAAIQPSPFLELYSGTKAAVTAYMFATQEKLRLDGWSSKIKLTTICPHYVKTKQDIIENINERIRCPPLETEEAVDSIISAILREDSIVTIPCHYKPFMKFVHLWPVRVQQLIRDHLLREYEFKRSKSQE